MLATISVPTVATPDVSDAQRRVLVALCRPLTGEGLSAPATNEQIAEELFLSLSAVKGHLRVLFSRFGLDEAPQNQKRLLLAERALATSIVPLQNQRPPRLSGPRDAASADRGGARPAALVGVGLALVARRGGVGRRRVGAGAAGCRTGSLPGRPSPAGGDGDLRLRRCAPWACAAGHAARAGTVRPAPCWDAPWWSSCCARWCSFRPPPCGAGSCRRGAALVVGRPADQERGAEGRQDARHRGCDQSHGSRVPAHALSLGRYGPLSEAMAPSPQTARDTARMLTSRLS